MSQNNSNDKAAMLAIIEKINQVEGFDPSPFAVDFTDLSTGEVRKRLPVMIQMAWFRLKYPEGKIAVQVTQAKDGVFIATAKVYPHYKDPVEFYLAEGTASRSYMPDKPTVSPREWAQTAAVGIALRNAGFGLQFAMAGEDFEEIAAVETEADDAVKTQMAVSVPEEHTETEVRPAVPEKPKELTEEEKLQQALQTPCPIKKFAGQSLGEVLPADPGAIKWIATKFTGDETVKAAALLICNHALAAATA